MATIRDREATIKTMVVEIKAMTVSGKQVTQALFKQLEEAPLIDTDTLQLNGVPWGRVNYHVGCSPATNEHLHVVWQWGDALRRSCVTQAKGEEIVTEQLGQPGAWFWAGFLLSCLEEEPTVNGQPISKADGADGIITVNRFRASKPSAALRGRLREFWRCKHEDTGRLTWTRKDLIEWFEVYGSGGIRPDWRHLAPEECRETYNSLISERERIVSSYDTLYTTLAGLDQLFIAV